MVGDPVWVGMESEPPVGNWADDGSDDETYDPGRQGCGVWEPLPADIIRLYEVLAKGEIPHLEWESPDRRSPSPLGMDTDDAEEEAEAFEEPKEEKHMPNEFDFDDEAPLPSTTPRRISGPTKTPRTQQKRVARMDNILSDLMRFKKLDRENLRQKSPGTPRRPLPKLKIKKDPTLPQT